MILKNHCRLKQHKLRCNEFNNYIHDIPYFHNDNFTDDVFVLTFETFGSSLNNLFRSNFDSNFRSSISKEHKIQQP